MLLEAGVAHHQVGGVAAQFFDGILGERLVSGILLIEVSLGREDRDGFGGALQDAAEKVEPLFRPFALGDVVMNTEQRTAALVIDERSTAQEVYGAAAGVEVHGLEVQATAFPQELPDPLFAPWDIPRKARQAAADQPLPGKTISLLCLGIGFQDLCRLGVHDEDDIVGALEQVPVITLGAP